jgi:hypothetical protein
MTEFESHDENYIKQLIDLKKKELSELENQLKKINDKKAEKAKQNYIKLQEHNNLLKIKTMETMIKENMEFKLNEEDMEDSNTIAIIHGARKKTDDEDDDDDDISNITNINQVEVYGTPKFGDILDFTGYRHYSWMFVGKNGKLIHCHGTYECHPYYDNIESGAVVPQDICKYLNDPWKKYSNCEPIQAYEILYNSMIVQKYIIQKVPKNCLYVYMVDYDESYDWELYAYKDDTEVKVEK